MPLDAICMTALIRELEGSVSGARIDKIHQPARDEVVLALHRPDGSARLLLSANPARPRLHLTGTQRENPEAPPMFCMLLRKHILGGKITELRQPPMERLCELVIDTVSEFGERVKKRLILEAIGRHSNLILVGEDGRIIDCLRRVDAEMSPRRQVLPGLFYRLPPAPDKKMVTEANTAEVLALLEGAPPERQISEWLLDRFGGISPLLGRELAFRAGGAADARLCILDQEGRAALAREIDCLNARIKDKDFTPIILLREGQAFDYSFLPVLQYGAGAQLFQAESFSRLIERFYEERDRKESMQRRGQDLYKAALSTLERTQRRLTQQRIELEAAGDREQFRQQGDIIMANLHRMQRGMPLLQAQDFYDPDGKQCSIPLDPLLTPQQNAARYYKKYNKLKTAEQVLQRETAKGEQELIYLESVLEALELAEGETDLREIRRELTGGGYLRQAEKGNRKKPAPLTAPMPFMSSAGIPIYVGKNNVQNDQLTLKTARRDDLWFHAKKMPGSHVILKTEGSEPDEGSVREAALLAAYYSKARDSQNVPVDYTAVKFVKKPAGAKPGMVIYETCSTVFVTPDKEDTERLRRKG